MNTSSEPRKVRTWRRFTTSCLGLTGVGLILSGCPAGADLENADLYVQRAALGDGDTGDGDVAPPCDRVPAIFEAACGDNVICHESAEASGALDLFTPGVEARLMNVPAKYPGLSGCPETPEMLINSAAIDQSLMLLKLDDAQTCGDGMPYPHNTSELLPADKACIRSWIQGLIDAGVSGGTGGASTGTGGESSGTGGDVMTGTGGAVDGAGGMVASADPIVIEAECALGFGCAGTVSGSFTGAAEAENDNTTVGYLEGGVTLTYSGIAAGGQDTISLLYSKANDGGSFVIHQDSAAGPVLATITPASTGDWGVWMTETATLSAPLSGDVTIVIVAEHPDATYVANLDTIELTAGSAQ